MPAERNAGPAFGDQRADERAGRLADPRRRLGAQRLEKIGKRRRGDTLVAVEVVAAAEGRDATPRRVVLVDRLAQLEPADRVEQRQLLRRRR